MYYYVSMYFIFILKSCEHYHKSLCLVQAMEQELIYYFQSGVDPIKVRRCYSKQELHWLHRKIGAGARATIADVKRAAQKPSFRTFLAKRYPGEDISTVFRKIRDLLRNHF